MDTRLERQEVFAVDDFTSHLLLCQAFFLPTDLMEVLECSSSTSMPAALASAAGTSAGALATGATTRTSFIVYDRFHHFPP